MMSACSSSTTTTICWRASRRRRQPSARGRGLLGNARLIRPGLLPEPAKTIALPTDLTVARVQESFAPPDTLSVWALPGFIALLERSGFSSIRHRLHFQSLLSLPLLAGTMTLVAAGFSMRPSRRGGVARMIGGGVAAGFALFVISKMAEEFGQSGRAAGGAGGLGAGRRGPDAGGRAAAAHGRRLTMRRRIAATRRGIVTAAMRRGTLAAALRRVGVVAMILGGSGAAGPLLAQGAFTQGGPSAPVKSDQPVTFTADSVEYDRDQVARHRHRPCRGLAERPCPARRQGDIRPQHRRAGGVRPRCPVWSRTARSCSPTTPR